VAIVDVLHAPFDLQRNHFVLGQRTIRARELRSTYEDFNVICHTSGMGVFEYRARVVRHAITPGREHIRFDTVKVFPHFLWWEVV
jgi:hypothetical protein